MLANRKLWSVLSTLVILSLMLVACGPTPTSAPTEAPATEEPAPAPTEKSEEPEPVTGEGTYLERAYAGEFDGTVVTWRGRSRTRTR